MPTDSAVSAANAITMSVTLKACQAVTSWPPAEYQGRKLTTSRPRPETAPTSSPDATRFMRCSVALAPGVLLHGEIAADCDRATRNQTEEEADLPAQVARCVEDLVEDQQGPDAREKARRHRGHRCVDTVSEESHHGRYERDEDDDQQVDVERVLGFPEVEVLRSAERRPADGHGTRDVEPGQKADDEEGDRGYRGDELPLRQAIRVQFLSFRVRERVCAGAHPRTSSEPISLRRTLLASPESRRSPLRRSLPGR